MNREERLRRELPAELKDRAGELGELPVAQVDLIVAALRKSRRDGREHEVERRRQRKRDDEKYGNYDEAQLAERNIRLISKTGDRATRDLAALKSLAEFRRHSADLERIAVENLRDQGISDPLIAEALGITRQSVGERFGRKGTLTPDRRTGAAS